MAEDIYKLCDSRHNNLQMLRRDDAFWPQFAPAKDYGETLQAKQ